MFPYIHKTRGSDEPSRLSSNVPSCMVDTRCTQLSSGMHESSPSCWKPCQQYMPLAGSLWLRRAHEPRNTPIAGRPPVNSVTGKTPTSMQRSGLFANSGLLEGVCLEFHVVLYQNSIATQLQLSLLPCPILLLSALFLPLLQSWVPTVFCISHSRESRSLGNVGHHLGQRIQRNASHEWSHSPQV